MIPLRRVASGLRRRLGRDGPTAPDAAAGNLPRPELVAWEDVAPSGVLARGFNIAGYFRAESGVGEVGRIMVRGAEAARIPFSVINFSRAPQRQELAFAAGASRRADHTVNLLCINADQTPVFARDVGPGFFRGRHTAAYWAWEVKPLPESMYGGFDHVDEVWVGSRFMAEIFTAAGRKPVHLLTLPVDVPADIPTGDRARLRLPNDYLFLFSFDFHSVMERKNPLGLIDAFGRAFGPTDGASLVIKTINGDQLPHELELLRSAALVHPKIQVIDGYFSADDKRTLAASCDCYISLHRSEGYGLTMAEAMALGKPVIGTGYSGNLAFMTPENSHLVNYRLAEVPPGADPYPVGAEWADPDLDHAAQLMRAVMEDPAAAVALGARARADLATDHSVAALGDFLRERLSANAGTARFPALGTSHPT